MFFSQLPGGYVELRGDRYTWIPLPHNRLYKEGLNEVTVFICFGEVGFEISDVVRLHG